MRCTGIVWEFKPARDLVPRRVHFKHDLGRIARSSGVGGSRLKGSTPS
jgi:hypothetical protein